MSTKVMATQQLADIFETRRDIQNLVGKVAAHYVIKAEHEIFDLFWANREDVSLGVNTGYYSGPDAIRAYYQSFYDEAVLTTKLLTDKFADDEKIAGKSQEELFGMGLMRYIPLDTGVMEVAEDGNTAKGLWAIRGSYNALTRGGPVAYWEWGWMACDFIFENGEWRIWHMLHLDDVDHPISVSWAKEFMGYPDVPEFLPMDTFSRPEPNVKCTLREYYSADRPFTPTPQIPRPYRTFSETFSYGV